MILQSITMAIKSILSNKVRSLLTVLGIVIGITSVMLLISVGQSSTAQITSNLESIGTNLLTVNVMGYRTSNVFLTNSDVTALTGQAGIGEIAPVTTSSVTAQVGTTTYSATVYGTTPAYSDIRNAHVAQGRFIMQSDLNNKVPVCVVGTEVAENLFGQLNVVGDSITFNNRTYTIVGVLQEMGSTTSGSSDNIIITPFSLAQQISGTNRITSIYVSADTAADVNLADTTLTAYLTKKFNSDTNAFTVSSQTQMLSTLNSSTQTMTNMLGGIAGISLLVGGIGIMNIMLVSVSERTREIGIRKAIGANRANILLQFLIEALIISLIGGIIGLILAFLGKGFLQSALSMQITISPMVALLAIVFSVVIGVIFGIFPANKASKLRPIEALHYEG